MQSKQAFLAVMAIVVASPLLAETATVQQQIQLIQGVGPKGAGHVAASQAWQQLVSHKGIAIPSILSGMNGANPLARNWLRSAAETVADAHLRATGKLNVSGLEAFLADGTNDPHARRLAYELILRVDASARERLIPSMLNDASLDLRRDAVAMKLATAKTADGDTAIAIYKEALTAARDKDQVDAATKAIRNAGGNVNLPRHFGFLVNWQIIGPFDNVERKGFPVAYPPEEKVDLAAHYPGKDSSVSWKAYSSDDEYGVVDLTKALDKHKGAIAYAYTKFASKEAADVQVRLGCINANKVWVNGELVISNDVYHAGMYIDQYTAKVSLKKGWNDVLLKIAQNEQEESWAQRWQFQFRVCDATGTAILSLDREDKAINLSKSP